jgi:hypothetical protein
MAAAITDVKAWRVGGEESFMSKTDYLIVFMFSKKFKSPLKPYQ